jgi:predicted ATP-binding protein involved in virulence
LKNLEKNKIYCFNNHYLFPKDDFSEIEYDNEKDIELYSLSLSDGKTKIPVNICAIVGENGSGKSALIELLYWINYNLASQMGLLEDNDGEKYRPNSLDLELLFSTDNGYILLKTKENESKLITFSLDENPYEKDGIQINEDSDISVLQDFFYSIVINYSQYALNAKEVGEWVNPLFHKNDGYQTPIVLNPMRTDGNIDINKERNLLSRRLQSNVLEFVEKEKEEDSLRNLANGKIATTFDVEYISDYFSTRNNDIPKERLESVISRIKNEMGRKYMDNEELCTDIISRIYTSHIEDEIPPIIGVENAIENCFGEIPDNIKKLLFYEDTMKYIRKKLRKMVYQYSIYKKFRNDNGGIENLDDLVELIKTKNSHTVFKIKGAILHLKYYNEIYGIFNPNKRESFSVNIHEFSELIQEIQKKEIDIKINNYIMAFPPFYKVTVLPDKTDLSIKDFSSGEKQKINSLSSIVYHFINLNSVDRNNDYVSYEYINLIFDEIEMYYHPEWQRTFISDLLHYLSKINPKDMNNIKGINMMFITHSPFILSDIPNANIIRLKDGKVEKDTIQTFGANVYDLLHNDFFMKKGFMGECAKQKVKAVIDRIRSKDKFSNEEIEDIKKNIEIIGDPFYKRELKRMLLSRGDTKDYEIFELEEKIKKIKEEKELQNAKNNK